MTKSPDLILYHGRIVTLDQSKPLASAAATVDGKFVAVRSDEEVIRLAGKSTKLIDLRGRRVLPGLIDNHLRIIRGGLIFNMELRWDAARSLWIYAAGAVVELYLNVFVFIVQAFQKIAPLRHRPRLFARHDPSDLKPQFSRSDIKLMRLPTRNTINVRLGS